MSFRIQYMATQAPMDRNVSVMSVPSTAEMSGSRNR